MRNLFQSVKHPNSITRSVTEKEKKTQEDEKEKLNSKEKENEKEAMTVSHARFQYYQQNYCLVLMSGLFGCRWHRYQQSTRNNRKRDLFWFTLLTLTFLYILFYFYFWLIAENDYNYLEWFLFGKLKKWIHWYKILIALASTAFAYFVILMMLALCHFLQGHQVYIHPVHIVFIILNLAACIAITVVVDSLWTTQWETIYLSLQMIGPFLHIGAVIIMTGLMWVVSQIWLTLSRKVWQLLFLVVLACMMIPLYIAPIFIQCPCLISETHTIPTKPKLFSHRGAEGLAPENTNASFYKALEYKVYGLESDVRISFDGIPFVFHDNTLRRTTDVGSIFPSRMDNDCSMFNMSDLNQLNVGKWFLEEDPYSTARYLSDKDRVLYENQTVLTLMDLLLIAKRADVALMFDVRDPPRKHPYHGKSFEIVNKTIVESGFNTSKLYWLTDGLQPTPVGAFLTYQEPGSIDELKTLSLSSVNSAYYLISTELIREYRNNNISLNIWIIDSTWIFSYFWCQGVSSVATRRIDWLTPLQAPVWTMTFNNYLILWVTVDVLSTVIIIAIFIVQRIRLFGTSFNTHSISLKPTQMATSYRSRAMKEKLIRDGVIDPMEDAESNEPGVVNQPAVYSMSSLPVSGFIGPSPVRVGSTVPLDQKYDVE